MHRNGVGSTTNDETYHNSNNSNNSNNNTTKVNHTDPPPSPTVLPTLLKEPNHHHHHHHHHYDTKEEEEEEIRRIAQLSNTALENMAYSMMNESSQLSMSLTQQLSTTTSGQHLLHTSTSLQVAIPSNIHALLQHNTPLLQITEQYEQYLYQSQYQIIQQQYQSVLQQLQRYHHIQSMTHLQQDVQTVETTIRRYDPSNGSMSTRSSPDTFGT